MTRSVRAVGVAVARQSACMVCFVALRVSGAVACNAAVVADSAGRKRFAEGRRFFVVFMAVAVFYALFVAEILRKAVSAEALHVFRTGVNDDFFAIPVSVFSVIRIALAVITCRA